MWAQPQPNRLHGLCVSGSFLFYSFFSFRFVEPKMNKSLAQWKNEWCVIPCSSCNTTRPKSHPIRCTCFVFSPVHFSLSLCVCCIWIYRILRQFFGRGSLILNFFLVCLGLSDCNSQTILCSPINFFFFWLVVSSLIFALVYQPFFIPSDFLNHCCFIGIRMFGKSIFRMI